MLPGVFAYGIQFVLNLYGGRTLPGTIMVYYGRDGCRCVPSGMNLALRVITAPNSAFAHIRDDGNGGYLTWSVGIFVLASVLGSVSFAWVDSDLDYQETLVRYVGVDLLAGIVFAAVIYLAGRWLGGNSMWRVVFSAVFYTNIIALIAFALLAGLALPAGGALTWEFLGDADRWDPESLGDGELSGDIMDDLWSLLGYLAVILVGAIAFIVWIVVVLVKAVKTVNGFGTAKAFGLVVLALAASVIVAAPLSL